MSSLQWALLLLGVAIALALVVTSIRDKRARNKPAAPPPKRMTGSDWEPPAAGELSGTDTTIRRAAPLQVTQSVPVAAPAPRAAPRPVPAAVESAQRESFDEFGVGKPRRRVAPEMPGAASAPAATPAVSPQLFGLYIAEYEGTNILGPKIHAALAQSGLKYGHKKIYHRYEGDTVQFSVASLVKPGSLDPAEAEGFATPGLSVFLVLPGPSRPVEAINTMLDTARALAKALNAEVFDSEQKAALTPSRELELRGQVEEWVKRNARGA